MPHSGLGCCPFLGVGSVGVDSLFIVLSLFCEVFVFGPCFVVWCFMLFLVLQAGVLLWLIHCLLLLSLFVGVLCLVLVLLFSTLCPSKL